VRESEDALSEGYAQALAGDAWLARAEQQLQELIDDTSIAVRGRDVRMLVFEHGEVRRDVIELRRQLEGLRQQHDRLRERSHAPSS